MSAWLPTLLLVLGAALQASAQDPAVEAPVEPAPRVEEPRPETDKDLDRELARKTGTERWEAMSEEQRALLRERFEAFRKLTPEQREALQERARQLEQQRRELRGGLEAPASEECPCA